MTYSLEFTIYGLPRMSNLGSKSHWRHAHAEAKRWQSDVVNMVGARKPPKPLERYKLTLTRYSAKEPDFDGIVRGFKSVVDGLQVAGVIADDKISNSGPWNVSWQKASPNVGRISVRVDEVRDVREV